MLRSFVISTARFAIFACVLTLSQQGLITTDKIYMFMRDSLKKSESEGSKPSFYRPSTNSYEGVYGLHHQLGYLATHIEQALRQRALLQER